MKSENGLIRNRDFEIITERSALLGYAVDLGRGKRQHIAIAGVNEGDAIRIAIYGEDIAVLPIIPEPDCIRFARVLARVLHRNRFNRIEEIARELYASPSRPKRPAYHVEQPGLYKYLVKVIDRDGSKRDCVVAIKGVPDSEHTFYCDGMPFYSTYWLDSVYRLREYFEANADDGYQFLAN